MHSATQQQQGFFLRDAFAQLDAVLQRKREASEMNAAPDAELRQSQQVQAGRVARRWRASARAVAAARARSLTRSPRRPRPSGDPAMAGNLCAAAPERDLH
jgi:hypothetical protein